MIKLVNTYNYYVFCQIWSFNDAENTYIEIQIKRRRSCRVTKLIDSSIHVLEIILQEPI